MGKREENWNRFYADLVEFKNVHGHCNPPSRDLNKGHDRLYSWVYRQLQNAEKLSPEQRQKLEAIGFVWHVNILPIEEKLEEQWNRSYANLVEFKNVHGHCNVCTTVKPLGQWVSTQRAAYSKGKLSPERRQKLEAIGFVWHLSPSTEEEREEQWNRSYADLVEFNNVHGHCNVSTHVKPLGHWVKTQRAAYSKGKLSPERRQKLEAIGFVWHVNISLIEEKLEEQWNHSYADLVEFNNVHGHCNVCTKVKPLGQWVSTQRAAYSKGKLSPERRQKLEAIGFVWHLSSTEEEREEQWNRSYADLVEFNNVHGHCNVSTHVKPLGHWVKNQRTAYSKGKLRQDRMEKLKSIGFEFRVRDDVTLSKHRCTCMDPNCEWDAKDKASIQVGKDPELGGMHPFCMLGLALNCRLHPDKTTSIMEQFSSVVTTHTKSTTACTNQVYFLTELMRVVPNPKNVPRPRTHLCPESQAPMWNPSGPHCVLPLSEPTTTRNWPEETYEIMLQAIKTGLQDKPHLSEMFTMPFLKENILVYGGSFPSFMKIASQLGNDDFLHVQRGVSVDQLTTMKTARKTKYQKAKERNKSIKERLYRQRRFENESDEQRQRRRVHQLAGLHKISSQKAQERNNIAIHIAVQEYENTKLGGVDLHELLLDDPNKLETDEAKVQWVSKNIKPEVLQNFKYTGGGGAASKTIKRSAMEKINRAVEHIQQKLSSVGTVEENIRVPSSLLLADNKPIFHGTPIDPRTPKFLKPNGVATLLSRFTLIREGIIKMQDDTKKYDCMVWASTYLMCTVSHVFMKLFQQKKKSTNFIMYVGVITHSNPHYHQFSPYTMGNVAFLNAHMGSVISYEPVVPNVWLELCVERDEKSGIFGIVSMQEIDVPVINQEQEQDSKPAAIPSISEDTSTAKAPQPVINQEQDLKPAAIPSISEDTSTSNKRLPSSLNSSAPPRVTPPSTNKHTKKILRESTNVAKKPTVMVTTLKPPPTPSTQTKMPDKDYCSRCTSGCTTKRCPCFKKGKVCDDRCGCKNCNHRICPKSCLGNYFSPKQP